MKKSLMAFLTFSLLIGANLFSFQADASPTQEGQISFYLPTVDVQSYIAIEIAESPAVIGYDQGISLYAYSSITCQTDFGTNFWKSDLKLLPADQLKLNEHRITAPLQGYRSKFRQTKNWTMNYSPSPHLKTYCVPGDSRSSS